MGNFLVLSNHCTDEDRSAAAPPGLLLRPATALQQWTTDGYVSGIEDSMNK